MGERKDVWVEKRAGGWRMVWEEWRRAGEGWRLEKEECVVVLA